MPELNLSVGDKVTIDGRFGGFGIGTVAKLTPTQIVLRNGSRYRRRDGREIGTDPYYVTTIRPATEADMERIRKVELARRLADMKSTEWAALPLEALQMIADLAGGKG